ncbi:MAG TPA: transcriptional regulator [Acidobacteriaceae bacterium]
MTTPAAERVHAELWISWASLLRSYAAAHGLNSHQFAVIEFGDEVITARAGSKWVRITHEEFESSEGARAIFALNENGTVSADGKIEEMDMAAERITRELMQ